MELGPALGTKLGTSHCISSPAPVAVDVAIANAVTVAVASSVAVTHSSI